MLSKAILMVKCTKCGSENTGIKNKPYGYRCHDCGANFTSGSPTKTVVEKSALVPLSKLEVSFTTKGDRIRLSPIGDIHVGAPEGQCDWDKLERTVDYILSIPEYYVIGMGDYMDCASKMVRKGPNVYSSSLSPMQQYEKIYKIFKLLADKGRLLGLLTGNHEQWIAEDSGIDVIAMLCMSLNVPFLGSACDVVFNVNEERYTGYIQHGSSSAKLGSTKIAAMMNATRDIYADFFCYGHVHQVAATKCGRRMDGQELKTYYILTGHFLKWQGGYAQAFGISPSPTGIAKISLFSNHHDIHLSI